MAVVRSASIARGGCSQRGSDCLAMACRFRDRRDPSLCVAPTKAIRTISWQEWRLESISPGLSLRLTGNLFLPARCWQL